MSKRVLRKLPKVVCLLAMLALVLGFSAMALAADYTIKLATSPPYVKGSPQPELMANFKKILEQKSGGKIEVQIFWGGQLGTEQKVVKDTQMGIIQMSQANVANFSPYCSAFYSMVLPGVFSGRQQAYDALTKNGLLDYFNEISTKQANYRVIVMYDSGYRALFNTQKTVKTPADMAGVKWRVPNNPVFIGMYKAWGVEPIPMAWGEVFSSLQTGVIHGGDNTLNDMVDFKFYEVAKHATESKHILQLCVLGINEEYFQRLPKDMQTAVVEAGKEAWAIEFKEQGASIEAVKKDLASKGMTVESPDVTPFLEAAAKINPQFAEKAGGKEVFDKIMSMIK